MSRHMVIEMSADASDNRPLGLSGNFLTGTFGEKDIATFATPDAARLAGERALNRRAGTTLFVPGEKKAVAA